METLKERINNEMVADHSNALEKNFDRAKKLIAITKTGKVDILVDKARLTGKDMVRLYCLGKLYAKEAGLSESAEVHYSELMNELGIKEGSVLPWLKSLREENYLKSDKKGMHHMSPHMVEKTLGDIEKLI